MVSQTDEERYLYEAREKAIRDEISRRKWYERKDAEHSRKESEFVAKEAEFAAKEKEFAARASEFAKREEELRKRGAELRLREATLQRQFVLQSRNLALIQDSLWIERIRSETDRMAAELVQIIQKLEISVRKVIRHTADFGRDADTLSEEGAAQAAIAHLNKLKRDAAALFADAEELKAQIARLQIQLPGLNARDEASFGKAQESTESE